MATLKHQASTIARAVLAEAKKKPWFVTELDLWFAQSSTHAAVVWSPGVTTPVTALRSTAPRWLPSEQAMSEDQLLDFVTRLGDPAAELSFWTVNGSSASSAAVAAQSASTYVAARKTWVRLVLERLVKKGALNAWASKARTSQRLVVTSADVSEAVRQLGLQQAFLAEAPSTGFVLVHVGAQAVVPLDQRERATTLQPDLWQLLQPANVAPEDPRVLLRDIARRVKERKSAARLAAIGAPRAGHGPRVALRMFTTDGRLERPFGTALREPPEPLVSLLENSDWLHVQVFGRAFWLQLSDRPLPQRARDVQQAATQRLDVFTRLDADLAALQEPITLRLSFEQVAKNVVLRVSPEEKQQPVALLEPSAAPRWLLDRLDGLDVRALVAVLFREPDLRAVQSEDTLYDFAPMRAHVETKHEERREHAQRQGEVKTKEAMEAKHETKEETQARKAKEARGPSPRRSPRLQEPQVEAQPTKRSERAETRESKQETKETKQPTEEVVEHFVAACVSRADPKVHARHLARLANGGLRISPLLGTEARDFEDEQALLRDQEAWGGDCGNGAFREQDGKVVTLFATSARPPTTLLPLLQQASQFLRAKLESARIGLPQRLRVVFGRAGAKPVVRTQNVLNEQEALEFLRQTYLRREQVLELHVEPLEPAPWLAAELQHAREQAKGHVVLFEGEHLFRLEHVSGVVEATTALRYGTSIEPVRPEAFAAWLAQRSQTLFVFFHPTQEQSAWFLHVPSSRRVVLSLDAPTALAEDLVPAFEQLRLRFLDRAP